MTTITPIDHLLTRYLSLLHTYTTLRGELNTASSQMHAHLARANFLSGRGWPYGQLDYDERMGAGLRVKVRSVASAEEGGEKMNFEIGEWGEEAADEKSQEEEKDTREQSAMEPGCEGYSEEATEKESADAAPKAASKAQARAILQFATLPPPSLRQAQETSTQLLLSIIPKLAAVDAEMRAVEIEVRRARKRARKAELVEEKDSQGW